MSSHTLSITSPPILLLRTQTLPRLDSPLMQSLLLQLLLSPGKLRIRLTTEITHTISVIIRHITHRRPTIRKQGIRNKPRHKIEELRLQASRLQVLSTSMPQSKQMSYSKLRNIICTTKASGGDSRKMHPFAIDINQAHTFEREVAVKEAVTHKRAKVGGPMVFGDGFRVCRADAETGHKCHRRQGRSPRQVADG